MADFTTKQRQESNFIIYYLLFALSHSLSSISMQATSRGPTMVTRIKLVVIVYIQPQIGRISTDIYFGCMGSQQQTKSVFFTRLIMSTFDVFRLFY